MPTLGWGSELPKEEEGGMKIILLRRDEEGFSDWQRSALCRALEMRTGKKASGFQRTDPPDHREHDALCYEFGSRMVLLPDEDPIPTTAMKRGVFHVFFASDGLRLLKKITVESELLVPMEKK